MELRGDKLHIDASVPRGMIRIEDGIIKLFPDKIPVISPNSGDGGTNDSNRKY